jgi:hypothetical protein
MPAGHRQSIVERILPCLPANERSAIAKCPERTTTAFANRKLGKRLARNFSQATLSRFVERRRRGRSIAQRWSIRAAKITGGGSLRPLVELPVVTRETGSHAKLGQFH